MSNRNTRLMIPLIWFYLSTQGNLGARNGVLTCYTDIKSDLISLSAMFGNGYSFTQSIVLKSSTNASIVEKLRRKCLVFVF